MQKRIVCVRKGDKYGEEYVLALRNMCEKHCPDADFYCLGDKINPCPTVPMDNDYPGWWSKMELFAPHMRELMPFLFVDLDTIVLGDIDDLFKECGDDFWMLRDFNRPNGGQSAQMWVEARSAAKIWDYWISKPVGYWTGLYGGDQDFLEQFGFKRFQDKFSGMMSYKVDKLKENARESRIVHFHGKPKPCDTTGWAKEVWDGYSKSD